jgi:hypothetical protein
MAGQSAPEKRPPQQNITRRHRPSDDLVVLQFKMTRDFVRAFKKRALDEDLKLNGLLKKLFEPAA